jgi:PAS domain S-box-containing protein
MNVGSEIARSKTLMPAQPAPHRGVGIRLSSLVLDRRSLLAGVLVFVGYILGAKLGLALTFQPYPVSVLWPTNALLLAAMLLTPFRAWWFLVLCAFPAHLLAELQSGVPIEMVLCWFVSNASEALIGAAGTRLLVGPSAKFDQVRSMGALFLCAGVLGPFLSSFLDSAFVSLNHFSSKGYWEVWRMRLCSNVFAEVIIVPAIVTWSRSWFLPSGAKLGRFIVETSLLILALSTVSLIVFFWQDAGPTTISALLYAPMPLLLWAAVRLGPTGTSTATFAVAVLAIWGAVHGRGPFTSESPERNSLAIQALFLMVSTMLVFLATSISERHRAEERFVKAFRSSPDAMFVSHLDDGHIIEVNERWERMFGYQRAETIGRTMFDLNIWTGQGDRQKLIDGTSSGEPLQEVELQLRTKTGELRDVRISADTDEIGGERCLITVIRDISDRKRADEAQQNLAHMSRLALVGEMTAMMAHEVNQPLGAILSNADAAELLLEAEQPNLEEIQHILSDIRKDDLRADAAIRRIRALLSKREFKLQPLDLCESISDVLRLVAGDAMRRRVQIRTELQPDLPLVLGDQFQLQQVLLNLILNGMDAMRQTPEPARLLTLKAREDGDAVCVTVVDRGHGVSPENMPHLFESFFTTKAEGMGLGLSMARSIIENHEGNLWLENNPGGGATFHFTLRTAPRQPASSQSGRCEVVVA